MQRADDQAGPGADEDVFEELLLRQCPPTTMKRAARREQERRAEERTLNQGAVIEVRALPELNFEDTRRGSGVIPKETTE